MFWGCVFAFGRGGVRVLGGVFALCGSVVLARFVCVVLSSLLKNGAEQNGRLLEPKTSISRAAGGNSPGNQTVFS